MAFSNFKYFQFLIVWIKFNFQVAFQRAGSVGFMPIGSNFKIVLSRAWTSYMVKRNENLFLSPIYARQFNAFYQSGNMSNVVLHGKTLS